MPVRWTLPDDHSAAGAARRHVGGELASWPNVDDIELAASELTTNAVLHGRPPVELALELVDSHLRLTVTSSGGSAPELHHAANHEKHGRGLALVGMLADDWGWSVDGARLSVWADFSRR